MNFEDVLLQAAKESAVDRYRDGETIVSIGRSFGVRREKVYDWLIELGAYTKAPSPGAQRKTTCQNDHDMAEWGRPMKGGGRYCALCKRERGAAAWRRRQQQKRSS